MENDPTSGGASAHRDFFVTRPGRPGVIPTIRTLARRLAEEGPEAEKVRSAVKTAVAGKPPKPGNILTALRRSPLVGADLDLSRPREKGRKVNL